MKYWEDIFYIINLDTRELLQLGRYDNYEDARNAVLELEKNGNYELVQAVDYR